LAVRENGRAVERSDDSLLDIVDWLSSPDLLDIRHQWDYSIAVLYRWQLTTKREREQNNINIHHCRHFHLNKYFSTIFFLSTQSAVPKGNCFLLLNTRLIRYDGIFARIYRLPQIKINTIVNKLLLLERERERAKGMTKSKSFKELFFTTIKSLLCSPPLSLS
jgi:hypothetical protein